MSTTPSQSIQSMDQNESHSGAISVFCIFCQRFAKELSIHPSTWNSDTRIYELRTTVLDIPETANTCPLCRLIISSRVIIEFTDNTGDEGTIKSFFADTHSHPSKTTIRPLSVCLKTHQGKIARCAIDNPLWNGVKSSFHLQITADQGISVYIYSKIIITQ